MMHKKVGGLTHKGEAGGALIALALGLALAGFGLAGCGEDPATSDDIAKAVLQKEKDEGTARNAYRYSLAGAFAEALLPVNTASPSQLEGRTLTTATALGGWGQTNAAYTLSSDGTQNGVGISGGTIEVTDPDTGVRTEYPVELKLKSGSATSYGGSYSVTGTVLNTPVTAVISFQVFNPAKKGERAGGDITLTVNPSEAGILRELEERFESSVSSAFGSLSNFWTDTPFNGTWNQADAKYTAAATVTQVGYITLPTGAAWTLVSATGTGNDGAKINVNKIEGITGAGTLTLGFTLSDTKVASKKVTGTVVIQVTAN